MALQLDYTTKGDVNLPTAYVRVDRLSGVKNDSSQTVSILYDVWKDADARNDVTKLPTERGKLDVEATNILAGSWATKDPIAACYDLMKTVSPFDTATDV